METLSDQMGNSSSRGEEESPFNKRLRARHNEETQEFPEMDLFLYRILQLLGTLSLKMKVGPLDLPYVLLGDRQL